MGVIKLSSAYQRRSHRHRPPLVPSLYGWSIIPGYRARQSMEIIAKQIVPREIFPQNLKELYEARGYELRKGQIRHQRCIRDSSAEHFGHSLKGTRTTGRFASSVAHPQIALRDRVEAARVELVELAGLVDEDIALQWLVVDRVVSYGVVRKVIDDFEG